jgi:hypothetical protein
MPLTPEQEKEADLAVEARKRLYHATKGKKTPRKVGLLVCSWCKRSDITWTKVKGEYTHVGCPEKPEGAQS